MAMREGFLPTRHGLPRTRWTRGGHTTAFGRWSQCATLHRRRRVRPLAASSYIVCRVEFVFPRRRLTHLCRKPRIPSWRLHICVRSRAPWQNSSSYRSLRPNWLFKSTSLVDVPDETSNCTCRLSGGVQPPSWPMTTPAPNGRVDPQQDAVVDGAAGCCCQRSLIPKRFPCRARALVAAHRYSLL